MKNLKNTKVLIVGAGPTGLALACELFRFGIDFEIIDQKEGISKLSKAMVIQAGSMEVFEEIGLSDAFLEMGQPLKRMNIMSNGKIAEQLKLDKFGEGFDKFPFALTLEQKKTEKIMCDHLVKNGISIHWNSRFLSLENKENGVI